MDRHLPYAKLLFPLSQSQYTVKSTKDFIEKIHNVIVPHGFNMIFDVKSLFIRVHLWKKQLM